MVAELPAEIDCRRLLASGGTLAGTIAAARLGRVGGIFRVKGTTAVRLLLACDAAGKMVVSGDFVAPLEAQCQRCLDWMMLELSGEFELDVVTDEDEPGGGADNLVLAIAGRLGIVQLIEDELLLACPMIPLHEARDCRGEGPAGPEPADGERQKPFAALGKLLATTRKDLD